MSEIPVEFSDSSNAGNAAHEMQLIHVCGFWMSFSSKCSREYEYMHVHSNVFNSRCRCLHTKGGLVQRGKETLLSEDVLATTFARRGMQNKTA